MIGEIIKFYMIITYIPVLFKLLIFAFRPDDIELMTDIITMLIIPWWISPLEFLSNLTGIIGGILSLGFLFLVIKEDLL